MRGLGKGEGSKGRREEKGRKGGGARRGLGEPGKVEGGVRKGQERERVETGRRQRWGGGAWRGKRDDRRGREGKGSGRELQQETSAMVTSSCYTGSPAPPAFLLITLGDSGRALCPGATRRAIVADATRDQH